MYEVWYWCWQKNEWRRLEGPDYADWMTALHAAAAVAAQAGRPAQVRDLDTGEVLHQTGTVPAQTVLHPAYW